MSQTYLCYFLFGLNKELGYNRIVLFYCSIAKLFGDKNLGFAELFID